MFEIIITESGQSIADIAMQAYGTISAEAMFALIEDNPAVFTDGLSSLVPAGVPVKVRVDTDFADTYVAESFTEPVNSTYTQGVEIPDSGVVEPAQDGTLSIAIAHAEVWKVKVELAVQSGDGIFGASISVLNNGGELTVFELIESTYDTEEVLFQTIIEDNTIILKLSGASVAACRYKILSFM